MRFNLRYSAFALLLTAGLASAVPAYYTFQGPVTGSNLAERAPGSLVSYVFMLDFDLPGYVTISGNNHEQHDHTNAWSYTDYFLSDYIGGDALADEPEHGSVRSFHYGFNSVNDGEISAGLVGSNPDPSGEDALFIDLFGAHLGSVAVGMGGFAGENSSGESFVTSDLTLTAIGDVNPLAPPSVPEPQALALMGMGLGLASFALLRNRKT